MQRTFVLLIFLIALISADVLALIPGKRKLNRTNLSEIYSENRFTEFGTVIYHYSEERSRVYLDINLGDLKYLPLRNNETHYARFTIFYELHHGYESKSILDSATLVFIDSVNYKQNAGMIVDFEIPAAFPGEYILKINLYDLNRNEYNAVYDFFKVLKSRKTGAQNYLLTDQNNIPLFNKHFGDGQYFKIHINRPDLNQLTVRYYNRKLPVAKTPFAVEKRLPFKFRADSLYTIDLNDGISDLLKLPYAGIYHFQSDTSQTEGLTLFHFDDGFPEIETPLQALLPLRYLTTQKEFETLLRYPDHKTAIDSFWIERASGQTVRAKNMISKYYQRVMKANQKFTSYQEGWKTDRGLIYIIYGPPTEIYRNKEQEQWIYGEKGNPLTIKFFFDEVVNPFTENDYSLQRSPAYKNSWYIAIENWRR